MTTLRERFIIGRSSAQDSSNERKGASIDTDLETGSSRSSDKGKGAGLFRPGAGALDHKKIAELILFSVLYIVAVMLVGQCLGISIIVAVALMSILIPIIWMAAIKRTVLFKQKVKEEYVAVKLPNVKGQMILFTAAGVLASGISYSGVGEMAVTALLQVTNEGVLAVTILVMALALVCSAFGVHPLVYTTVIGGSLSAVQLGVSPVYLALLLAMGWALGNAVCPTSANTIAVSQPGRTLALQIGLELECVLRVSEHGDPDCVAVAGALSCAMLISEASLSCIDRIHWSGGRENQAK